MIRTRAGGSTGRHGGGYWTTYTNESVGQVVGKDGVERGELHTRKSETTSDVKGRASYRSDVQHLGIFFILRVKVKYLDH